MLASCASNHCSVQVWPTDNANLFSRVIGSLERVRFHVALHTVLVFRCSSPQLAKKGSTAKLVIKLAEHSGTGLVVVEGGVERDANDIQSMMKTIQVWTPDGTSSHSCRSS